jgi:lipopolysaccharide transport system ATP-binding protein
MSSEPLIEARNLGKAYHIYDRPELRLRQFLLGWRRRYYREFWALRGVNFVLSRSETVGFVGRNGAGKSTLLQLVCGTLAPSEGEVVVRGRISALLELGSGFNPEFSGHDNVYLYGALLGLSREEIDARYDRIMTFADIGEFIDHPVKTYSSGMVVRLAFAVAINVDPEILVVDEALAVGDARFTARCMTQLRAMQDAGVSILFVGHDLEAVSRLCTRAYVLHDGHILFEGEPGKAVSWYLAFSSADFDLVRMRTLEALPIVRDETEAAQDATAGTSSGIPSECGTSKTFDEPIPFDDLPEFKLFRYGDGTARIVNCVVKDARGRPTTTIRMGERMIVEITAEFDEDLLTHLVGFYVKDRLNLQVIGINTYQERVTMPEVRRGNRCAYSFEFDVDVRPGYYAISPSIAYNQFEHKWMDWIENATVFRVVDPMPQRIVFGICHPAHRSVRVTPLHRHDEGVVRAELPQPAGVEGGEPR